ncbi:MAG TPA: tRNA uridine-5-carboxymethylaminomethyl(34) synthesis GTPase MnmE [Nannocystis exedens]|nr:tRNA uridine-5-carboxymethylaminomethyl(34) synthesis GTPase MnmE [Nannocystis exedens]
MDRDRWRAHRVRGRRTLPSRRRLPRPRSGITSAGVSSSATIVGVATGSADGGVAIIRLSGPDALAIARHRVGSLPPPRRLARRSLALDDPTLRCDRSGPCEHALVVQMPGPRSFTGEDVVEFHVHGGERNVASIVACFIASGAKAAGPGDFSRRAFANGRLSLDQAEGIAALIAAQTQSAVDQARRLVAGELGANVELLRVRVGDLRAEVEANLDFAEDVEDADELRWAGEVGEFVATLGDWLRRFEYGRRARERVRIVLAGPPNAGKSSLFNALLGRERSIVNAAPGTTRDYVEAELQLGPYSALLVDTAGLREGIEGTIESAGIALSREQIGGGDLVLWVEAADSFSTATAISSLPEKLGDRLLWIESKRDLGQRRPDWIGVSTANNTGLDALRRRLQAWIGGDEVQPWIGLARHRDCAEEAMCALVEASELLRDRRGTELVAFQLAVAERRLAEVTGRSALGAVGEQVLERIFSRFCIGK